MEDDYESVPPTKKTKLAIPAEAAIAGASASLSSSSSSSLMLSSGRSHQPRSSREYASPEHRRQLLKRALDDVVTYGISVRLAAESHGVAKSSLSDFIRRHNVRLPARRGTANAAIGVTAHHRSSPSSASPPAAVVEMDEDKVLPESQTQSQTDSGFGVAQWRTSDLPTLVPYRATSASWKAASSVSNHRRHCHLIVDNGSSDSFDNKELQHQSLSLELLARSSELLSLGIASEAACQGQLKMSGRKKLPGASLTTCSMSNPATTISAAWRTADLSKQLCEFVNRSPSPFHVVAESRRMLDAAGFSQLREEQSWSLKPNQRHYVTRNGSTIFAFATGGRWQPGNGFSIVGAHTDSPCLRLKPVSQRDGAGELQQCGVETYGGGLWYSWFDRDLTAAGRVVVRESNSRQSVRLVNLEAPLFKVSSLAIHLDRSVNEDGFKPNRESNLAPILCRKLAADAADPQPQQQRHPAGLLARVADRVGCQPGDIVDWELYLADTQPAGVTGLGGDFVSSPRLDNLLSCYAALTALIEAPGLENDSNCRVVCLYDHEEIGSESAQGAGSALTEHFLRRLCSGAEFETAIPKSMLVSADVAHAVHPNYEDKHERRHRPTLFGGVVIKEHVNQRYATNVVTSSLLRECLRLTDPAARLQDFVIRQDLMCGSTIGPILSAKLGLATVDVGSPILGMHSIRETAAAVSPGQSVQLFSAFLQHYPAVREAFHTDG